jgi:CcmD family protein
LALVAVFVVGLVGGVLAQGKPPEGFILMDPNAQRESIPHAQLVFAAYAFVWLTLLAYVWTLWRRIVLVERDLVGVTQQLRERKH